MCLPHWTLITGNLTLLKRKELFKFCNWSYCLETRRCKIDGCEKLNVENDIFEPDWLQHSTPYKNGKPDSCHRYEIFHSAKRQYTCDIDVFNRSSIVYCGNGSMIFRTNEVSIVNQVICLFCLHLGMPFNRILILILSLIWLARKIFGKLQWLELGVILEDWYSFQSWDTYRIGERRIIMQKLYRFFHNINTEQHDMAVIL